MKAKRGSHILARRDGNHGYYASVVLEVEVSGKRGEHSIEFAEEVGAYRAGLSFGIAYAHEKSALEQGIRVRVLELRGHVVDTTEVVVAYAAAHALWDALGVTPPRELVLDARAAEFTFPK